MKKLEKKFGKKRHTIEAYSTTCACSAVCHFCAGLWKSQYQNDMNRYHTSNKMNI